MQPRLRERLMWIRGPFTSGNRFFLQIDSFRERGSSCYLNAQLIMVDIPLATQQLMALQYAIIKL